MFRTLITVAMAGLMYIAPVQADGSGRCEKKILSSAQLTNGGKQAARLLQELETKQIKLAVVGRVGSDISGKGLKYTHAGIVWKNTKTDKWQFTHMLNHCGKDTAAVYDEGLLKFFLDDPFSYDTSILTFHAAYEDAFRQQMVNKAYLAFADKNYSMIAYPFSTRFINSNQFILEVMASAEAKLRGLQISSRADAQVFLKENGFKGTKIRIYFLESLFGALFKENVSFSDHPKEEKEVGEYSFVSVRSLGQYARDRGIARELYEIPGIVRMSPQ